MKNGVRACSIYISSKCGGMREHDPFREFWERGWEGPSTKPDMISLYLIYFNDVSSVWGINYFFNIGWFTQVELNI